MGNNFSTGNISNLNNCIIGNNNVVNGRTVSGRRTEADNQPYTSKTCICLSDKEADMLLINSENKCVSVIVRTDESINRIIAEVKTDCYAPTKEQSKNISAIFDVEAETKTGFENKKTVCIQEKVVCSEDEKIVTAYDVRVPKTLKEICVYQTVADIDVSDFEGMLRLRTVAGNITVSNCTFNRSVSTIHIETGCISFIGNTANAQVNLRNTTGNIELMIDGGNGSRLLSATTTTGNIHILNKGVEEQIKQNVTGEEITAEINGCSVFAKSVTGRVIK